MGFGGRCDCPEDQRAPSDMSGQCCVQLTADNSSIWAFICSFSLNPTHGGTAASGEGGGIILYILITVLIGMDELATVVLAVKMKVYLSVFSVLSQTSSALLQTLL